MKKTITTIASLALALSASAFEVLPNHIVNGDFENYTGSTGQPPNPLYFFDAIPGWTNESKGVGDSTIVEARDIIWAPVPVSFSATLNGFDADNLTQTIATDVGRTYTLAFQWKPRRVSQFSPLVTQTIHVFIDGVDHPYTATSPLLSALVPAWINEVPIAIVATGTTTTIEFASLQSENNGGVGPVLDNVRLTTPYTSAEQIGLLLEEVAALNLANGIDNSLDAKLTNAQASLDDLNLNNDPQAAIGKLQAFIYAVEAQSGNHISSSDADDLVDAAQAIIDGLLGA
jgi:hypothetical protein